VLTLSTTVALLERRWAYLEQHLRSVAVVCNQQACSDDGAISYLEHVEAGRRERRRIGNFGEPPTVVDRLEAPAISGFSAATVRRGRTRCPHLVREHAVGWCARVSTNTPRVVAKPVSFSRCGA
jgi:hypothetical protein